MFPFGSLLVPDYEASGGFTPFDVPGLIAYYNSENATLSGSDAASFIDISGVTGDALPQLLPGQAPTVNFADPDFNGTPSFNWDNASNTAMDTPVFTIGPYTIFQVCLVTNSPTYLYSFSAGDYTYGGTGFSIYSAPRPGSGGLYDAGDVAGGAGWPISVAPQVFTRRFDGTAVGDELWINSAAQIINLSVTDNTGTSTFNTWLTMMAYWSGGIAACTGKWGATLIYDNPVSDPDRYAIEQYLIAYYGL